MNNNQDLNFLNQNNNQDLFKQIDQEMKEKQQENSTMTNDEFIKSLPDWDLPPLYEKVRRVNRQ
ncbi:MAG: hypothetical protein IJN90_00015 [Bacilli bacterium]|nr:hypothetical protein [Bacilli bacterium]